MVDTPYNLAEMKLVSRGGCLSRVPRTYSSMFDLNRDSYEQDDPTEVSVTLTDVESPQGVVEMQSS